MIPAAAKASTECRITESDLWQTTTRFDTILSKRLCLHPHLSEVTAGPRTIAYAYAIADSRCHSGGQNCDKEEGDWLWIVARASPWIEQTVAVNFSVESVDPSLLKVRPNNCTISLPQAKLDSETPIYVFPFYAKKPRAFCDCRMVRLIRYPKDEFCRAPLRVSTDMRLIHNGVRNACEHRSTRISVAVPPIFERIAHIEDVLLDEYQAFRSLLKRFPLSGRTESERVTIRRTWIDICQHEIELGELLGRVAEPTAVCATDATTLVSELTSHLSGLAGSQTRGWPTETLDVLREVREKLQEPGKAATAKLRISLPIIPFLASYNLELDSESAIMQTWQKVKVLFRKAIH